jgi:hypothetical protein
VSNDHLVGVISVSLETRQYWLDPQVT